jgi:hypothetical protein
VATAEGTTGGKRKKMRQGHCPALNSKL